VVLIITVEWHQNMFWSSCNRNVYGHNSQYYNTTSALEGVGGLVVNAPSRPLYCRGREPVPIVREDGWTSGQLWTGMGNLAPTGIQTPDRPTRSEPVLYIYTS
jgi:hypothetical protein